MVTLDRHKLSSQSLCARSGWDAPLRIGICSIFRNIVMVLEPKSLLVAIDWLISCLICSIQAIRHGSKKSAVRALSLDIAKGRLILVCAIPLISAVKTWCKGPISYGLSTACTAVFCWFQKELWFKFRAEFWSVASSAVAFSKKKYSSNTHNVSALRMTASADVIRWVFPASFEIFEDMQFWTSTAHKRHGNHPTRG